MRMQTTDYVNFKVEKSKLEKAKKFFKAKTNQEVVERIFDWFEYAKEVNEAMEKVGGKAKIKRIYE